MKKNKFNSLFTTSLFFLLLITSIRVNALEPETESLSSQQSTAGSGSTAPQPRSSGGTWAYAGSKPSPSNNGGTDYYYRNGNSVAVRRVDQNGNVNPVTMITHNGGQTWAGRHEATGKTNQFYDNKSGAWVTHKEYVMSSRSGAELRQRSEALSGMMSSGELVMMVSKAGAKLNLSGEENRQLQNQALLFGSMANTRMDNSEGRALMHEWAGLSHLSPGIGPDDSQTKVWSPNIKLALESDQNIPGQTIRNMIPGYYMSKPISAGFNPDQAMSLGRDYLNQWADNVGIALKQNRPDDVINHMTPGEQWDGALNRGLNPTQTLEAFKTHAQWVGNVGTALAQKRPDALINHMTPGYQWNKAIDMRLSPTQALDAFKTHAQWVGNVGTALTQKRPDDLINHMTPGYQWNKAIDMRLSPTQALDAFKTHAQWVGNVGTALTQKRPDDLINHMTPGYQWNKAIDMRLSPTQALDAFKTHAQWVGNVGTALAQNRPNDLINHMTPGYQWRGAINRGLSPTQALDAFKTHAQWVDNVGTALAQKRPDDLINHMTPGHQWNGAYNRGLNPTQTLDAFKTHAQWVGNVGTALAQKRPDDLINHMTPGYQWRSALSRDLSPAQTLEAFKAHTQYVEPIKSGLAKGYSSSAIDKMTPGFQWNNAISQKLTPEKTMAAFKQPALASQKPIAEPVDLRPQKYVEAARQTLKEEGVNPAQLAEFDRVVSTSTPKNMVEAGNLIDRAYSAADTASEIEPSPGYDMQSPNLNLYGPPRGTTEAPAPDQDNYMKFPGSVPGEIRSRQDLNVVAQRDPTDSNKVAWSQDGKVFATGVHREGDDANTWTVTHTNGKQEITRDGGATWEPIQSSVKAPQLDRLADAGVRISPNAGSVMPSQPAEADRATKPADVLPKTASPSPSDANTQPYTLERQVYNPTPIRFDVSDGKVKIAEDSYQVIKDSNGKPVVSILSNGAVVTGDGYTAIEKPAPTPSSPFPTYVEIQGPDGKQVALVGKGGTREPIVILATPATSQSASGDNPRSVSSTPRTLGPNEQPIPRAQPTSETTKPYLPDTAIFLERGKNGIYTPVKPYDPTNISPGQAQTMPDYKPEITAFKIPQPAEQPKIYNAGPGARGIQPAQQQASCSGDSCSGGDRKFQFVRGQPVRNGARALGNIGSRIGGRRR
ncbi:MAG: hypothetical protein PHQ96_08115 [Candidatus Omnitrophica bacterium]|nr:hypothetical protein [Candidatus Omnitrophota bacterium]